jgi:sec-independent protein translocase protein TatA
MGDLLQPWHLVVLGVVAFLLFGAKRLPELGKGLGEGLKGFKEGLKGVAEPTAPAPSAQQQSPPPAPSAQQQNAAPAPPASAPIEPK